MPKPPKLPVVRTVRALRKSVAQWRGNGDVVALVPTMGALHEGHLSLVRLAHKKADRVIASIFVNPTQFAEGEDLGKYPRQEAVDRAALALENTDLLYAPAVKEMYRDGFSTSVRVEGLADVLCGRSRPGHFDGVATVVTKLLTQAGPDIAVFGEKDFQQLLIIRRLVNDLDLPVKIIGGPIVREKDGLALSSRNAYLTANERAAAPKLHAAMNSCADQLRSGKSAKVAVAKSVTLLKRAGFGVDYLDVRDQDSLQLVTGKVAGNARLFAAVFLGKTRLIDNIKL